MRGRSWPPTTAAVASCASTETGTPRCCSHRASSRHPSNAPRAFAGVASDFDWYDLIGTWFFSGAIGVAKPAPEIYAAVEAATGLAPERLLFVDDDTPCAR